MFKQRRENAEKKRGLVVYNHQDSIISEQFRRVYTNLKYCSVDRVHRSILIVSPESKEGRSTVTINLGATIAQLGEKVLVVDADLRRPSMHHLFKMDNNDGLTNILLGYQTLKESVKPTGLYTLDVLTSGPILVNPVKLLGSSEMKELKEEALNLYDVVLIDTPPFLEVTDANILTSLCSGVIFVIKQGKTKAENVTEVKRLLDMSGANIIGSLLNSKKGKVSATVR